MIVKGPEIASMQIAVAAYTTSQRIDPILTLLYISLPVPEAVNTRKIGTERRWRRGDKAARVEIVAPRICGHTLIYS
jgi:hypothetical protein